MQFQPNTAQRSAQKGPSQNLHDPLCEARASLDHARRSLHEPGILNLDKVAGNLARVRQLIQRRRRALRGPDSLHEELQFQAPWLLPKLERLELSFQGLEAELDYILLSLDYQTSRQPHGLTRLKSDLENLTNMLQRACHLDDELSYEPFVDVPAID